MSALRTPKTGQRAPGMRTNRYRNADIAMSPEPKSLKNRSGAAPLESGHLVAPDRTGNGNGAAFSHSFSRTTDPRAKHFEDGIERRRVIGVFTDSIRAGMSFDEAVRGCVATSLNCLLLDRGAELRGCAESELSAEAWRGIQANLARISRIDDHGKQARCVTACVVREVAKSAAAFALPRRAHGQEKRTDIAGDSCQVGTASTEDDGEVEHARRNFFAAAHRIAASKDMDVGKKARQ